MRFARLYLICMLPTIHFWLLTIHTFGLMLWLAAVVAAFIMDRGFRRARITVQEQGADALTMVAIALVAGILGAKLWHVLDTPEDFHYMRWSVLWDTAGFAWYGGLLFGLTALLVMGWRAKIGALRTLDLAAPAAAVGYGIGRIGCFLSGDGCYGIVIKPVHFLFLNFRPWGISFPHGEVPIFVPVYPTPLYELAAGLLIGWLLWRRGGRPHPTGLILGHYLMLTGLARFLVEFLRRNPKILWGLSNAHLASAGAFFVGLALTVWLVTRPVEKEQPDGEISI